MLKEKRKLIFSVVTLYYSFSQCYSNVVLPCFQKKKYCRWIKRCNFELLVFPMMELYIWPSEFGLPSVDPQCLQFMVCYTLFLRIILFFLPLVDKPSIRFFYLLNVLFSNFSLDMSSFFSFAFYFEVFKRNICK